MPPSDLGLGLGRGRSRSPRSAGGRGGSGADPRVGRPTRLPAPRFVEEAIAAGIEHAYDGEFTFFVGGGVGGLRLRRRRAARPLPGGRRASRPRCSATEARAAARSRFERMAEPDDRPDRRSPARTRSTSTATTSIDLAVLRLGENVLLRGLGDCRFERGQRGTGLDGGDAWTTAFSATWETPDALADAGLRQLPRADDRRGRHVRAATTTSSCARADGGAAYAPPTRSLPGWCTLSMLFSDWDRSGRRDLRVIERPPLLPRWRRSSCGGSSAGRGAPSSRPRGGLADGADLGHGHRQPGPDRRRLPGGLPDQPGATTSSRRSPTAPAQPTLRGHRAAERRRPPTSRTPATTTLPSTAWHAEFQDVNNDGFIDLFVPRATWRRCPTTPRRTRATCCIGPAGWHLRRGRRGGRASSSFARGRGAALADLNLDGLLDLVVVNRRENVGLWRNVGAGTRRRRRRRWATGWRCGSPQDGPNRDAIGAWVEVEVGDRVIDREVTVGGGHAGGQLAGSTSGSGRRDRPRCASHWPDGEVGPMDDGRGGRFVDHRARGRPARRRGPQPDE